MPNAPPKYTGAGPRTSKQSGQPRQRKPDNRPNMAARGYGHKWRVASKAHIRAHPHCVFCGGYLLGVDGEPVAQACVDHDPPHCGDMRAFWDKRRWRSAHGACHNSKTARQDRSRGGGGSQKSGAPAT